MALAYRGVVRGRQVVLEEGAALPEGAEVEVVLKEGVVGRPRRGAPQRLIEYLNTPSRVSEEDVDELMRLIRAGKRPARYRGLFDGEPDK
jgi:hypothetical protein